MNASENFLFREKKLFTVPFHISYEDQAFLLHQVRESGSFLPPEINMPPFWIGMGITSIKNQEVEDVYLMKTAVGGIITRALGKISIGDG